MTPEDTSQTKAATVETAHKVAKQAEAVTKSAQHMEASAGAVKRSAEELTDSADRRTVLAADRTVLAAERTYAAWIRTGLVAMASGIGAKALLDQHLPRWLVLLAAIVMIAFSVFCYLAAIWRQVQSVPPPAPDTKRVPSGFLIIFSLLMSAVAIAALIGVVFSSP